jgi:multidrug efflux system membrane fusion protein
MPAVRRSSLNPHRCCRQYGVRVTIKAVLVRLNPVFWGHGPPPHVKIRGPLSGSALARCQQAQATERCEMSANSTNRRNSILIASAIAVGLAAWMLSGLGNRLPEESVGAQGTNGAEMRVSVRTSTARVSPRQIIVSARTEPDRAVEIKAETDGRVVAVGAERGAFMNEGDSIVELSMRDRAARLAETEALIRQRELEYESDLKLRDERFVSEAALAASEALLVAARSARERILLDIEHTRIKAPFDSVIFDRLVEIGDYVGIGDPIAQVVDMDPLIVVGNINQRDIGSVRVGTQGSAAILGGPRIDGRVRYVAPVADESTRSFRVELAVPNPDRLLSVGTSAELILGAEEISAHVLSPALLTLADDGAVGVETVDHTNRVRFLPVELAGSVGDSVLVTGLPPEIRIITVGGGFVSEGQTVSPVEEASAPGAEQR